MVFLALGLAVGIQVQAWKPVLWLPPDGSVLVEGVPFQPVFNKGARAVRDNAGIAYDFDGTTGGIRFGDLKPLRLSGSITVSTWLYLRQYVSHGPGAQVLFRGDDRSALDPFSLVVHENGTINFGVQNGEAKGMSVSGEVPTYKWIHVLGSFNVNSGELNLWLNGELIGYARTSKRPLVDLDNNWDPGVGVGNVQGQAIHNQPLDGRVADLRLYDRVLTPEEVGYQPNQWEQPPISLAGIYHLLW